jgi:hypothetical protein
MLYKYRLNIYIARAKHAKTTNNNDKNLKNLKNLKPKYVCDKKSPEETFRDSRYTVYFIN